MNEHVLWAHRAVEDIAKIDPETSARILAAIDRFVATGHGDVKRLQGERQEWRLRVGDWRVRFTADRGERTITIMRVLRRDEAYRR